MKVLKSIGKTGFLYRTTRNREIAGEEKFTDLQNLGTLRVDGGGIVKGIMSPLNKACTRGVVTPTTGSIW